MNSKGIGYSAHFSGPMLVVEVHGKANKIFTILVKFEFRPQIVSANLLQWKCLLSRHLQTTCNDIIIDLVLWVLQSRYFYWIDTWNKRFVLFNSIKTAQIKDLSSQSGKVPNSRWFLKPLLLMATLQKCWFVRGVLSDKYRIRQEELVSSMPLQDPVKEKPSKKELSINYGHLHPLVLIKLIIFFNYL